jgi:hypothetical protein
MMCQMRNKGHYEKSSKLYSQAPTAIVRPASSASSFAPCFLTTLSAMYRMMMGEMAIITPMRIVMPAKIAA